MDCFVVPLLAMTEEKKTGRAMTGEGGGEGGLFVIAGSVARHDAASCFGFIIKFSKILKNMRQTLDSLGC